MPSSTPVLVDAVELRSRSTATTQNPTFYLVAESSAGNRHDLVVKPRLRVDQCFNEWVVAELARKLDIRVPASFAVSISAEFVTSLLSIDRPYFAAGSIAFGCERFSGYLSPQHPLRKELLPEALRLLVFDVLVQNADRRLVNPNFQVNSDGLMAFDHELVWADRMAIGTQSVDPLAGIDLHWCSAEHFPPGAFDGVETWLASLRDVEIDSAISAAATIWPVSYAAEIASGLKSRRDSAPHWLARLNA